MSLLTDLFTHLRQSSSDPFFPDKKLLFFSITTNEYPLLFCSRLMPLLEKRIGEKIIPIDLDAVEFEELKATFTTLFLGNYHYYWLRSFDLLEKSRRQAVIDYLGSYGGPHRLIFFSTESLEKVVKNPYTQLFSLPATITKDELLDYAILHYGSLHARQKLFFDYLGKQQFSLDIGYLLMQYAPILIFSSRQEFEEWFATISTPTSSLFQLSQFFFSAQSSAFFDQWRLVGPRYGEQFWLSFWSEQLWRAYFFIWYAQKGDWNSAKKIGNKLPFSFLQRDWKRHQLRDLQKAHAYLYLIDYRIKHGGGTHALDLFYHKFLNKQFS